MLMSELLVATTLTYDIDVNALCTNIYGNYTCMCMSAWVVWRWINLYVLVGTVSYTHLTLPTIYSV